MIDTILAEVTLAPTRVRLAIKELLVKRLERIAVLYQRSHSSDSKVKMPSIHANALESLKSSISRDRALIAERKGETPRQAEQEERLSQEAISERLIPESQSPKSAKQRLDRDKRKSRRKSYMK